MKKTMTEIVAIHQPNFFPWLGYFNKTHLSDAFIFLDDVQYQKKGGTWSNRVKLMLAGQPRWITAPIVRAYHGVRSINEMEFERAGQWQNKIIKTISLNYRKTPFFRETMDFFEPLIASREANISNYNTQAILAIAEQLGIPREKFFWSSQLPHSGGANELLISLTKCVGGDVYMCGGGAEGYQIDSMFAESGVSLSYQNFEHPRYPQIGSDEFAAGLSIIDAVFNVGWEGSRKLIANRRNVEG